MILAAAQFDPIDGDISKNIDIHLYFIDLAAKKEADLILFPEMSLTGYCREEASTLSFNKNDIRLDPIKKAAINRQIMVIVGAPIILEGKLYIGSFFIYPDGSELIYTKQYLHEGEEVYYEHSFEYNPKVKLGDDRFAAAICADINHPEHAEKAAENDSSIYLASIFFSRNGIESGHKLLGTYARKHHMAVLMSNFCGTSWRMEAGGRSAFWSVNGDLIGELGDISGLLIVEKKYGAWKVVK